MPTQNILAVANSTDRNEALNRQAGKRIAPVVYDQSTQTFYLKDMNTGDLIPIAGPGAFSGAIAVSKTGLVTPGANAIAGLTLQPLAYARYDFAVDGGGAPGLITPVTNSIIPANAIITGTQINATTAVTSTGTTTVSIGLSAGAAGAAALLAATAKASFTTDVLLAGIPVPSDATKWIKMSAAGTITLTSATTAIGGGVIEIFVEYVLALNA
jgi:hypothetical protein